MGNKLGVGGYGQVDSSGGGYSEARGDGNTSNPLIEDIPDVSEETSQETLDDIISMIITKYENVINSNQLLDGNVATLEDLKKRNQQLQGTLAKIIQILKEKQNASKNLEKQNEALQHQVDSLKDVINITRDLLNIRNAEVEHLHEDLQSMQEKITKERNRQTELTQKMESASKLNDTLKEEYQKQMDLFSKLRVKYDERVDAMERENSLLQKQLEIARNLSNQSSTTPTTNDASSNQIIEEVVSNGVSNTDDIQLDSFTPIPASAVTPLADVQEETTGAALPSEPSVNGGEDSSDEGGAINVSVVLKTVDNVLQLEKTESVESKPVEDDVLSTSLDETVEDQIDSD